MILEFDLDNIQLVEVVDHEIYVWFQFKSLRIVIQDKFFNEWLDRIGNCEAEIEQIYSMDLEKYVRRYLETKN